MFFTTQLSYYYLPYCESSLVERAREGRIPESDSYDIESHHVIYMYGNRQIMEGCVILQN